MKKLWIKIRIKIQKYNKLTIIHFFRKIMNKITEIKIKAINNLLIHKLNIIYK